MNRYIIVIIIIIFILLTYYWSTGNLILVKTSDGKKFYVINMENSNIAAEYLSRINVNISKLLFRLKQEYGHSHPIVMSIIKKYNPDVLSEHRPNMFNSSVAYTTNKGEDLNICLRNWNKNGELLDFNTVMFVALHELTHIGIKEWGHPTVFWESFKFILKESIKIGIYTPIYYQIKPVEYCNGLVIAYNPFFDEKLSTLI